MHIVTLEALDDVAKGCVLRVDQGERLEATEWQLLTDSTRRVLEQQSFLKDVGRSPDGFSYRAVFVRIPKNDEWGAMLNQFDIAFGILDFDVRMKSKVEIAEEKPKPWDKAQAQAGGFPKLVKRIKGGLPYKNANREFRMILMGYEEEGVVDMYRLARIAKKMVSKSAD